MPTTPSTIRMAPRSLIFPPENKGAALRSSSAHPLGLVRRARRRGLHASEVLTALGLELRLLTTEALLHHVLEIAAPAAGKLTHLAARVRSRRRGQEQGDARSDDRACEQAQDRLRVARHHASVSHRTPPWRNSDPTS